MSVLGLLWKNRGSSLSLSLSLSSLSLSNSDELKEVVRVSLTRHPRTEDGDNVQGK